MNGRWESIYEVQGRVRKKVVKRSKNTQGGSRLKLGNECRRGKRLLTVHSAVKFGTGLFNGTRSVDKMLLRVAYRELEMRKSGDNLKGLIGIKIGLGYRWLGRDERDLKGIEYVKY